MATKEKEDELRDELEEAYRQAVIRCESAEYPPLDFSTFILSMNASCLINLGESRETSGKPDLGLAKHTIDMLAMLEEKTRDNLNGEEERLLLQMLDDLRTRFIAAADKCGS